LDKDDRQEILPLALLSAYVSVGYSDIHGCREKPVGPRKMLYIAERKRISSGLFPGDRSAGFI
jgi:hypothetical protein